jgi:hypothetical protein
MKYTKRRLNDFTVHTYLRDQLHERTQARGQRPRCA